MPAANLTPTSRLGRYDLYEKTGCNPHE